LYFKLQKSSKQIYKYHKIIYINRFLQLLCANFGTEPKHASSNNISEIQLKIVYGFCRNIDLGILLFNFSSKNYSSKVYTYLEKLVVLVTQSTTKLSLPILDFSTSLYRFHKFQPTHKEGVESLCTQAPGTFKPSQLYPSPLRPDPRVPKPPTSRISTAEGRPPPMMWVRRRQTNGMGLRLALPSTDWWWRFSRVVTGERRRQSKGGATAVARTALRIGTEFDNVLPW
jgi:hypothetical protein